MEFARKFTLYLPWLRIITDPVFKAIWPLPDWHVRWMKLIKLSYIICAPLARHPGLATDTAALDRPGIDPAWITEEGGLRLRPDHWPDLGGMDGFYIALLRKT